jgi:hypothetical protein
VPLIDAVKELELLIRSRYALFLLDTAEEKRVRTLLRHLADRLGIPLFDWNRARGLSRLDLAGSVYDTRAPEKAFQHIASSRVPALYHFHALAGLDAGTVLAALAREASRPLETNAGAIVLTGQNLSLPPELEQVVARVELPGPGPEEFRALLSRILRDLAVRQHVEVSLSRTETTRLLQNLAGMTLMEAEKILTKAIIEDGRLGAEEIRKVIDAKRSVVEREGLLEYYPLEDALTDIADLKTLKEWLNRRRAVIRDPERAQEFGLAFPRGVLLLGIPGCGKSLSAKAVAAEWELPLLKLDPSNLYNKYVGESERNFKRAMRTAERMAPVVLWIDELEKAFASGGSEDGGVSMRILGSFLSWMQERRGDVFIIATANDITRLPSEFLRKGRFDEIFFVDLPDEETRREVFRIHLTRRGHEPTAFDLESLARLTTGFSGSEIEQVVLSGLYSAFSEGTSLSTAVLAQEAKRARPLSTTMAERISHMRTWARDRAVLAN